MLKINKLSCLYNNYNRHSTPPPSDYQAVTLRTGQKHHIMRGLGTALEIQENMSNGHFDSPTLRLGSTTKRTKQLNVRKKHISIPVTRYP